MNLIHFGNTSRILKTAFSMVKKSESGKQVYKYVLHTRNLVPVVGDPQKYRHI